MKVYSAEAKVAGKKQSHTEKTGVLFLTHMCMLFPCLQVSCCLSLMCKALMYLLLTRDIADLEFAAFARTQLSAVCEPMSTAVEQLENDLP